MAETFFLQPLLRYWKDTGPLKNDQALSDISAPCRMIFPIGTILVMNKYFDYDLDLPHRIPAR